LAPAAGTRGAVPIPTQHVAHVIAIGDRLEAVVVVDLEVGGLEVGGLEVGGLESGAAAERTRVLRHLHWSAGWLETLFRRRQAEAEKATLEQLSFTLDLVAAVNAHETLRAAAIALVNELAARLSCRRASIGLVRNGSVRLLAISHACNFQKSSPVVLALEDAMEEALDQGRSLSFPPAGLGPPLVMLAHANLARLSGSATIASAALRCGHSDVALVTLERDDGTPFDDTTMMLLGVMGGMLGPIFDLHRRADRLLAGRIVDGAAGAAAALAAPDRPGLKVIATACLAAMAVLLIAREPFRVSGKATLEALQQHVVVAPFDGYVASANARAGDIVHTGQVLATLDDRELRLDDLRAAAAVEEQRLKHNEALGKQDRAAALVTKAALDEARAQLAIDDSRIGRAVLRSAGDGIVVSGDLSDRLGAPVERGKTLFVLAPLDRYRLSLQVAGSDVALVAPGQHGALVLTGLTNRSIPFTVRTVIPIASVSDGQNLFRVEAELGRLDGRFRPGMEGIGKIVVGRRPVLELWLRPALEWVRMTVWRWWP
jgi:multidrug resistance efflux pump